jgi:hypothetical protein
MSTINAIRIVNRNNEEAIKNRIQSVGKVASGVTITGVNSKIVLDGKLTIGEIYAPHNSAYRNSQYNFMESGRKKGATPPPLSAIVPWMKTRNIPEAAKYAIAVHIGKEGFKAVQITKPAIKTVEAANRQVVNQALRDELFLEIKKALTF